MTAKDRRAHDRATTEILGLGLRGRGTDARAAGTHRGAPGGTLRAQRGSHRTPAPPRGPGAAASTAHATSGAGGDLLERTIRPRRPHLWQSLARRGARLS